MYFLLYTYICIGIPDTILKENLFDCFMRAYLWSGRLKNMWRETIVQITISFFAYYHSKETQTYLLPLKAFSVCRVPLETYTLSAKRSSWLILIRVLIIPNKRHIQIRQSKYKTNQNFVYIYIYTHTHTHTHTHMCVCVCVCVCV